MKNFADALVKKIAETNNPTVIGLDPKLDYIPDHIKDHAEQVFPEEAAKATAKALWLFNKEIIDNTCDIVPAVKLQYAYYEMYGVEAIKTMLLTARYAQKRVCSSSVTARETISDRPLQHMLRASSARQTCSSVKRWR